MNFSIVLQIVQLAAQFLQTTHALSPSATTTSLSNVGAAIMGAKSPDPVKWLQGALNAAIGAHLEVDGEYGPQTEAAVVNALGQFLNQQESAKVLEAVKIVVAKFGSGSLQK